MIIILSVKENIKMAGNRIGGAKAASTNKRKYGEDFYKTIGVKGGSVKNNAKGFGSNRELARTAGAKGGRISRRTKGEE